jgi:proline iminopeptidase
MRKTILKIIKYAVLFFAAIVLCMILLSRTYNVPPFQKKAGIQYWDLATGSKIGYTHIPAKGQKKQYPVIYLHGGPGGYISDRNIEMLSPLAEDGYDVYLYDQVGGGQSNRLKNIKEYTAERHRKDLEEITKKIGARKVILIGQSWGAVLATLFIAANPDKVDKCIFTAPGPVYPIHKDLATIKSPDSLRLMDPYYSNQEGNKEASNIRSKVMVLWAETFGKKLAPDEEADNFETYLGSVVNRSAVCDTTRILPEAGAGFYARVMTFKSLKQIKDPRPALKNSRVPVLVMKGQCDNQPWGYTEEYLELFSNHQLVVIPGAGHFIWVEKPAMYSNTIRDFLNK